MFFTDRRISEEVWIERTVNSLQGQWAQPPVVDEINFSTGRNILLTGVGLYTGFSGPGYVGDV